MSNTFFNIIRLECKKAFKNKYFFISILCGLCFGFISGLYSIERYRLLLKDLSEIGGNPMTQAFGLYNCWIGGECGTLGFTCFYTLLPVLAVLPYGWSYCDEKKRGYLKIIKIRTGRLPYIIAKYIATFLSGGTVIVLPLIFNLLFVACFIPAVKPTMIYSLYYPMHYGAIWSDLFFTRPLFFTILYLILDFLFAGFFATLGLTASQYTNNRIASVFIPYFLILALHYGRTLLYGKVYKEISPLNFLHATSIENVADKWIILIEAIILFIITFVTVLWKGWKYEDL